MTKYLYAALLLVGMSLFGSTASAQAHGGWAGTTCHNVGRMGMPPEGDAKVDYYRPEAGLENLGSQHATVACAIGESKNSRTVFVDYVDSNPNYGIFCYLYSVAYNGMGRSLVNQLNSPGGMHSIPYRSFFQFQVPEWMQGYVVLTCSLPPYTALIGWNAR